MEIKLNLLPQEKKTSIRKNMRFRFVMWQGMTFVTFVLFYIGVLYGMCFVLEANEKNQQTINEQTSMDKKFQDINETEKIFQETNMKVENVSKFQKEHIAWSQVFVAMDSLVPKNMNFEIIIWKVWKCRLNN